MRKVYIQSRRHLLAYNKINLCNEDHRQLCNGVVLNYTLRCSEIIGFNLHRICYTLGLRKKNGMKFLAGKFYNTFGVWGVWGYGGVCVGKLFR